MLFTWACRNYTMKSKCCTLDLFCDAYARKYFGFITDAVGDQVSPIKSLFFKCPLTTILNFNLSRLPSDFIFLYSHIWRVSLAFTCLVHILERSRSLFSFFICFRAAFNQAFLITVGSLVTSKQILVLGKSLILMNLILLYKALNFSIPL